MNIEYVLSLIDNLKKSEYSRPSTYYGQKKGEFEYNSYKCSAIKEIKMFLIKHQKKYPIDIIEDFRSMVDKFACEAKGYTAKFMFSVYYDVATDILDMLLGMKGD